LIEQGDLHRVSNVRPAEGINNLFHWNATNTEPSMADERGMTIHFTDGSKMSLSFPKQVKSDETVSVRLEKILDKKTLMIGADGALLVFPFSNIKYLRVSPSPPKLPDYVIKDASILP
jgi:hypothetical protein